MIPKRQVEILVNGVPVKVELRVRLDKQLIAEKIRQGIDIESLENEIREKFHAFVQQIERVADGKEQ